MSFVTVFTVSTMAFVLAVPALMILALTTVSPLRRSVVVTVQEARDTFNAPLTMKQQWFRVDNPIQETVCAENNDDFFHQNLFPLPEAGAPDF